MTGSFTKLQNVHRFHIENKVHSHFGTNFFFYANHKRFLKMFMGLSVSKKCTVAFQLSFQIAKKCTMGPFKKLRNACSQALRGGVCDSVT